MKRLAVLLLLFISQAHAQQRITWPGGKKAVIILTYDDALASQLRVAVPQLNASGFKGTFFLTGVSKEAIPQWRSVSSQGHELANHTLYHPCLIKTLPDRPADNSKYYSVYSMLREIGMENNLLFAVDGKVATSYAYPCTELEVGGVKYVDSLRKSGLIKYARIGGDSTAVITEFQQLDPLLVPAYGLHEKTSAEQLIAFVKRVRQSGGMGVFMFHGVGGDYITTDAGAHQQLLDYLEKNRKDIWVATFQQVMDYIAGLKKSP